MDKNLYLIIIFSLLVLGVVIYLIIKFTNNKTDKTDKLTHEGICGDLQMWKNFACNTSENFADTATTDPIDITLDDELYNINKYYSPSDILQNANSDSGQNFNLPTYHYLGMINLKNLDNFNIKMNRNFSDFYIFLLRIIQIILENNEFKFDIFLDMIHINIALYFKDIENNVLFWIKTGIYFKLIMLNAFKIEMSMVKCFSEDNLTLYLYNKELTNIDCKDCDNGACDTIKDINIFLASAETTDPDTNEVTPASTETHRISINDAVFQALGQSTEKINSIASDRIKEYNKVSKAYLDIIQFYIHNSEELDKINTKYIIGTITILADINTLFSVNEIKLIKTSLGPAINYFKTFNYVYLTDPVEEYYPSTMIEKLENYKNTI